MNRTRRTIGISVFVMLVVLGTGWALEKASSSSHAKGGAPVSQLAKASDATTGPSSADPRDTPAAAPEYDRSDLLLSQG